MESSSRMRRCLRRNYQGTDHLGSAANYEDYSEEKKDQSTPIFSAEAISMDAVNEGEEHVEVENGDGLVNDIEKKLENEPRLSESAEQTLQASIESSATQLASDENLVQDSPVIAPGYVPSDFDERIILELPTSMVRPLKVVRGTFQVSFMGLSYKLFIILD